MYEADDLVRIAKRENNKKRNYLVINRLQGKHIPVKPGQALGMFRALADKLEGYCMEKQTLLVGFAETATAIGAAAAARLGTYYIQTTRETVPGAEYLYFSEAHSHAAEQRLVKQDLENIIQKIRQVVFIEDEITTGNTILNIVNRLEQEFPGRLSYAAASVLNGMEQPALELYQNRKIRLFYLVKTDQKDYPKAAEQYSQAGNYIPYDCAAYQASRDTLFKEYTVSGRMDARRLVDGRAYEKTCLGLWEETRRQLGNPPAGRVLVLGTEEFMYPALLAAEQMAQGGAEVWFHATTRSPIAVFKEERYPVHVRYELPSFYDKRRKTFLYDIGAYDQVLVITDAWNGEREGMEALAQAVAGKNKNIYAVWWR